MATVQEILDFDIPRPSFVLRPSRAAPLPSKSYLNFNRGSAAWEFQQPEGVYRKKASGDPRIHGNDEALLVEGYGDFNHFADSTDITNGVEYGPDASADTNSHESIFKSDTTTYTAYSTGMNDSANRWGFRYHKDATTNWEAFSIIIEKQSYYDEFEIKWFDNGTSGRTYLHYQWGTRDLIFDRNDGPNCFLQSDETLIQAGPNGNEVRRIVFAVKSNDNDGASFGLDIAPYGNIVHHYQWVEAQHSQQPMVTTGTSASTLRDNLTLTTDPSWYTPDVGTWVFEFMPLVKRATGSHGNYTKLFRCPNVGAEITVRGLKHSEANLNNDLKFQCYNGNASYNLGNNITPFEWNKGAVSHGNGNLVVASNGESTTAPEGDWSGTGQLDNFLDVPSFLIKSTVYIPAELSEGATKALSA